MNQLAAIEAQAIAEIELEERAFALAQRKAKVYAESTFVPNTYKSIGAVLIAQNMAKRLDKDVLTVMQNLYVVNGKPGWSAQFLISLFNTCGRFDPVRFRFTGTKGKQDYGCIACTVELTTGEKIEGPEVTLAMAKAEGWGKKWDTMPELMLRYRAASFLIKTIAPEVAMGFGTVEEAEDAESRRERPNVQQATAALMAPTPAEAEPELQADPYEAALEKYTLRFVDCHSEAKLQQSYDDLFSGPPLSDAEAAAAQTAFDARLAKLKGKG